VDRERVPAGFANAGFDKLLIADIPL